MKRRSFISSLVAIAVAVSVEVLGFKESIKAAPYREPERDHLFEMFPNIPVRTLQQRSENGKEWFRVALSDNTEPSPEIPEFKDRNDALKWAKVMLDTVEREVANAIQSSEFGPPAIPSYLA